MKTKTHSGAKKRIRITKTGKLMTGKTGRRHLLQNKSKAAKKRDIYGATVANCDTSRVIKALGIK